MKSNQIKIGGYYACDEKSLIRRVVQETESGNMLWQAYDLATGGATGDFMACSKQRIATWANREASDEEIARIRSHQADVAAPDSTSQALFHLADLVLRDVSDQQLLAEVQRRGLK